MALQKSKASLHLLDKVMLYDADMEEKITIGKCIREARLGAGLTQAQVASALGVTPQAVSGWERDETHPDLEKFERLAEILKVPLQQILTRNFEAIRKAHLDRARSDVEKARIAIEASTAPQIIPGDQLVGARDFPIYAAAQGGNGFMIVHTEVMEYVRRPVILEGVPDSYGVLIVGESMVPAYRPGDMALVHPRRPPERGTDVILYDHDRRTGDAKSMIKHLVGINDRQYKLEQYNPAKTFTEHRADWPICHQVVGMYKGRR